MGVHGLWDLLAPVGRRVSVETLAGRRLAIDASIWMVQFMKAMRDEKGEMIRNAHLVGFFRRICKLLFLRTKPVFVFDGGTPAIKRRTVVARRRQREKAQAKFRKTAEKLLLNQLKAMRLKELAESLENQKLTKVAKGKKVMLDQSDSLENNVTKETCNVEKMDELLAASLAAEDCDGYPGTASVSGYGTGSFDGSASTSVEVHLDEDNEDDEEMILPIGNGGVDPAVLAALPPSMQLDLLVQMRERLMAENRQKYQRVKKAPQRFSELQIESYLKTVAFRREIDEVQKAAAGKGINGMHTSRIASEANREFIFSSSFTGDKQELVSSGVTKKDKRQEQTGKDCSFFDLLSLDGSAVKSHPETTSAIDEPEVGTNDVVQTYLDERGHVRVSRVRAMGIRMTRDLQRNLDLMRELEQERPTTNATELVQFDPREKVSVDLGSSEGRKRCLETAEACSHENDFLRGTNSLSAVGRHTHEPAEIGNTIEISFVDNDDQKSSEDVEGLFADLVAGKPMMFSTIGDSQPIVHTSDPALDCEWEEGLVGEEPDNVTNARNMEVDAFQVDGFNDKVIELDWEEGMPDSRKDVHLSPGACEKCPSKGSLEEDLALQEAIRRSLEDFAAGISITVPSESEKIEEVVDHTSSQLLRQENEIAEPSFQIVNNIQVRGTLGLLGDESDDSSLNTYVDDVSGEPLTSSTVSTSHDMRDMTDCPKSLCSPDNQNRTQDVGSSSFLREIVETKSVDVADVDLNESNSHAAPMCPSNKASDVAMHHEESTMEQPVSDTHLKSQLADENCPDLVQEIKDDDMVCAVESSEGDDVEFKKTCLEDELQDLSREYIILGEEQRKLERNAESVNSEMFVECQELLQMFGLPYIIAPMEAEAQCAFMERAKLVDGVVTDDSDVFLFGARSVYKNIFDNRKYVETYFMKDIEDDLGLDQEKLIRMALLLGSDYTEGISGIGIVNAIEVIHAFPDEDGLSKFREWIESPDPMILGKLGMKSTTELSDNGSSFVETDPEGPPVGDFNDLPGTMDSQTESNGQKLRQFFMDKHRKVSKNWHVPSSFPSEAVISAYRSPQVDKSSDPFSWGKPDLFALRRLCWEKFGWGGPKADELLLPVLKEYNKHETQLRLEAFYTFNERFAKIRSKRIKQAVKGITKNQSTKLTGETDTGQDAFDDIQKRTVRSTHRINKRKTPKDNASGISDHSVEHKKSQPRKRRAQEIGTGRRKAKIRGNPQAVATGRRKSKSASECAETSSSDADHIDDLEHGMLAGTPQGPCNIRKSMRPRKAANYVECDVEIDESLYLNKSQANCSRAELVEEQLSYDAAGSFAVEPPVGEDSLVTDGLSKDYLVQGGGFCADEDEVETGEAQWCSLLHNDGASCDTEMDHVQVCGTFTDDGAIRNEHECDPSETATEATKIVNPSLCFSEAQMCENNSIERKLIESSRGSLERVQQPKHINEEDEDDQHLIWNDNLSRRDNRGHRSSKTDDQTGVKASSTDNCGHRNSKSDDQTGVKVKASSTMPNSRRNKRMRSSP